MTLLALRKLIDPRRPITYGIVQAGPDYPGGVPYIRPTDMSESGGVPEPGKLLRTSPEIARSYARAAVAAGDVVLSIGPSYGKVMLVPDQLAGANLTQGTARLAPGEGVHAPWLFWALQSSLAREYWDAAIGGATFRALNLGPLGETPMSVPQFEEQRRIADFLDDQVTRIDAALAERGAQLQLLPAWLAAHLEELLVWPSSEGVRLLLLTDPERPIQYGIVLPGPDFPGGVPIVKGGDVAAHRMDPDLLQRTSPEIDATCPRSRLVEGDLLIAIRGSVGELATVPASLSRANITQDAARIAPLAADPVWLRWVLQTPTVQGRIRREVTGATVKGINIGALRRLMIPTVTKAGQVKLGREAERSAESIASTKAAVEQSVRLLQERKRSLITAAVAGEFDVSTAGPRAAAAATV